MGKLANRALRVLLTCCVPLSAEAGALDALGIRVETRPGTPLASVVPAPRPASQVIRPADALPDGLPARGGTFTAWLIDPTTRYGHGVLGDAVEAGGLGVVLADGRRLDYRLDAESVFEDLRPRLADLDGDGAEEIIVVRSYLDRGAALAVFAVRGGALVHLAETPPIGRSSRWLNPLGVGDFDGDGRPEVAYVETPHIGGTLRIWSLDAGRLVQDGSDRGYSNHTIGSRALGLSAILDLDGDGSDDLMIPSASRRALRLVSFAGGRFRELGALSHGSPIASDFARADLDGNGRTDIAYNLADGTLVMLLR